MTNEAQKIEDKTGQAERTQPQTAELSASDLDSVAGGKSYYESHSNVAVLSVAPPTNPTQPVRPVELPKSVG